MSVKLYWQGWTGLSQRPTALTHLICLSGTPWDEHDNGHLIAGVRNRSSDASAGRRSRRAGGGQASERAAPGEQQEQTVNVTLAPPVGAIEEEGLTPGEVRRRNEAVRRTSRERFSSLATPSRHGAAAGKYTSNPPGTFGVWAFVDISLVMTATATMSARRDARARSGAALAGQTTPSAAFGRRSAATAGGLGAVGEGNSTRNLPLLVFRVGTV